MEGIALEEGQYGDWISVKNIKSGRIILAKVIYEKKVSIKANILRNMVVMTTEE